MRSFVSLGASGLFCLSGFRREQNSWVRKNCLKHLPREWWFKTLFAPRIHSTFGTLNVSGIFTDASETTSQKQETTVTAKHRCSPLIFSECAHTPVVSRVEAFTQSPLSRNTRLRCEYFPKCTRPIHLWQVDALTFSPDKHFKLSSPRDSVSTAFSDPRNKIFGSCRRTNRQSKSRSSMKLDRFQIRFKFNFKNNCNWWSNNRAAYQPDMIIVDPLNLISRIIKIDDWIIELNNFYASRMKLMKHRWNYRDYFILFEILTMRINHVCDICNIRARM